MITAALVATAVPPANATPAAGIAGAARPAPSEQADADMSWFVGRAVSSYRRLMRQMGPARRHAPSGKRLSRLIARWRSLYQTASSDVRSLRVWPIGPTEEQERTCALRAARTVTRAARSGWLAHRALLRRRIGIYRRKLTAARRLGPAVARLADCAAAKRTPPAEPTPPAKSAPPAKPTPSASPPPQPGPAATRPGPPAPAPLPTLSQADAVEFARFELVPYALFTNAFDYRIEGCTLTGTSTAVCVAELQYWLNPMRPAPERCALNIEVWATEGAIGPKPWAPWELEQKHWESSSGTFGATKPGDTSACQQAYSNSALPV